MEGGDGGEGVPTARHDAAEACGGTGFNRDRVHPRAAPDGAGATRPERLRQTGGLPVAKRRVRAGGQWHRGHLGVGASSPREGSAGPRQPLRLGRHRHRVPASHPLPLAAREGGVILAANAAPDQSGSAALLSSRRKNHSECNRHPPCRSWPRLASSGESPRGHGNPCPANPQRDKMPERSKP